MGKRSGSADLPLHGGRVPAWLAGRMARLGRVIAEAVVHHYGSDELLRRLSHPFWFQSFGAVMGMDWHSSGITTSVLAALKRGLAPIQGELGIYVCGGRGAQSRKTPGELLAVGERTGLDGDALGATSRLVAKVDSAAVQDGFDIYLHGFIVSAGGAWTVVQQGMNGASGMARRYHWLSEHVASFVDAPHAAIDGEPGADIIDLTNRRADANRRGQLSLLAAGPDAVLEAIAVPSPTPLLPHLVMPAHHDVRAGDVVTRRLHGTLRLAAEAAPAAFVDLLAVPGVGTRTIRALAMASEIIHGGPSRFTDPARYSVAHGGKDGHPFPVPLRVYDQTIHVLRQAVDRAKLGNDDKLAAIRRLDAQARALEAGGLDFERFLAGERAASHQLGGRTVTGWSKPPAKPRAAPAAQLSLFRA